VANYVQGFYQPRNPDKYIGDKTQIIFRSSWERRIFIWADNNESVLEWSSEPFPIQYFDQSTNKIRRYFPDLFVKIRDKQGITKNYLIEVKPEKQTREPQKRGRKKTTTYLNEVATYQKNLSKWAQAEKFCEENNVIFKIITEKELGI
jgi:hypothetical protein